MINRVGDWQKNMEMKKINNFGPYFAAKVPDMKGAVGLN